MSNNGPTFTKATYDHQPPKLPAPCPARRKADQEVRAIFAEKDRTLDKRINELGLAEVLFPGITLPKGRFLRRM